MQFPILTSGIASEYSLSPVVQTLRANAWNVTELDFANFGMDPWQVIHSLPAGDTGYITSAHTNVSRRFCESVLPSMAAAYPNQIAPIEIMAALKPKCSIYIPHDLLSPFGTSLTSEHRYLDLYDYVLAPYGARTLQSALGPGTRVLEAGWIKYRPEHAVITPPGSRATDAPSVVVFVTMFVFMLSRFGVDGLCDYLLPLLGPNVRVKLPAWNGADMVAARLRDRSAAMVVDPNVSSTELILGADLVICNDASSIHAEASLLGRPSVSLVDGLVHSEADLLQELGHLPNISFEQYRPGEVHITEDRIRELATGPFEPTLKPFDTELVLELLHAAE